MPITARDFTFTYNLLKVEYNKVPHTFNIFIVTATTAVVPLARNLNNTVGIAV